MQEDALMMRIAEGDEDSFVQLYNLWCRRVMAYAFRALKDLHEAQDVVQETFIQVYRAAPAYRAEGKFGAFVFRIAGNLVRGRFRNSRSVDSLSAIIDDEELPYPDSLRYSPEDSLLYSIDIERLLALLPARQREALILVASGVSYAEGADMMQITQDAFAQLVLRGRRTLKLKMARMSEIS
ncbi:MAG: RNA polymerase sigma factor [Synergistaceae bacterium]|jgi:RNA polymerase sigma-70 factor (ECF subfamily)|nr:RNA polymerase sigma factor [Synergistaceae bacterium]